MLPSNKLFALVLATSVLWLAGACGSENDTTQSAASNGESPLADSLGLPSWNFNEEESEARYAEAQRQRQALIATCMKARGFEYTPVDYSQFVSFSSVDSENERGSDEWIAKHGFGISTQQFAQSSVGPDLVGFDDERPGPMMTDLQTDPNQEYVESLSESDRDAYYAALHGSMPTLAPDDPDFEDSMEDFFANSDACNMVAQRESDLFDIEKMRRIEDEFGDELDELYDRLESHPKIVAHNKEVSSCVAEAGLSFTSMEQAREQINSKLNAIDNNRSFGRDPFAEAGLDPEKMSQDQIDEFFREMQRLSPQSRAALADIQAEEIALAKAVSSCGGGEGDTRALYDEVRLELENDFVARNADRLKEFAGTE